MSVVSVIQFDAKSAPPAVVLDKVQEALEGINPRPEFVFGPQIQDQDILQITSEQKGPGSESTPHSSSLMVNLHILSETQTVFHIALNRPAFGPNGFAKANVTEFALSYFPASRVTPEFQTQIQTDFLDFERIYSPAATGSRGWASGWLLEEQNHEGLKGEKAKCFCVMRGWDSMDLFQKSLESDAYKEAIPVLFNWQVPFKMWHIQRLH
ncbi:uncharacterized protein N7529_010405 [Penicillium soppii]|uniref:uncharacterized protein n=1 Tax=Penicillium soppii TaxID=69789 RepID=UPI002549833D|nr:uncharacterized protein N7529_010405 [Penicillium soppii]KAJ5856461.1 hypothetical protein N7529_010405 [Penicillium soppii]